MDRETITQVLAEMYECDDALENEFALMQAAQSAANKVGATVVGELAVRYVPRGLTVAIFWRSRISSSPLGRNIGCSSWMCCSVTPG